MAIGPVLFRRTRPCPDGYLANTCVHCGSTQGALPLGEELIGFIGGDPSRTPLLWSDGLEVDYPLAALVERQTALFTSDLPSGGEGDHHEADAADDPPNAAAALPPMASNEQPVQGLVRSIRSGVYLARASKPLSACRIGVDVRIAVAPMRQSINLRTVSPW